MVFPVGGPGFFYNGFLQVCLFWKGLVDFLVWVVSCIFEVKMNDLLIFQSQSHSGGSLEPLRKKPLEGRSRILTKWALAKWWLEDYFSIGFRNFSGAMLNFRVV